MKPNLPNSSASPFPGPRPYAEHEGAFFFGRDAESDLVAQGFATSRLTLLSGPPGVGKTSLLLAGVIPRLRGMETQFGEPPIIIFWDTGQGAQADPLNGLIDEIQRCCVEALTGFTAVRVPRVRALEHVIEYWAAKAPLFIILDRFDAYLLSHGDEDGEGKFSVEFPRVVKRADLRVNFLLAMRGGAHAKLGRLAQRLPQLFERSLRLKPLGADAARAAIVLPIQAYNHEHPELVPVHVHSALVDYVIRTVGTAGAGAATGDKIVQVDASSLQATMQELWDTQIGHGTLAERANGEPRVLRIPALADDVELPVGGVAVMPEFGVMTDMMARVGAAPDLSSAELPDTAPRRRRPARSGRTFAALAFLFVAAFTVFGAAGWIGQAGDEKRDESDKQQALSVQQKADQALARARETLEKAARWQAANQQPSQEKAPETADRAGAENTATPSPPAAVGPVERLAEAPTEKPAEELTGNRSPDGEAAQRKPAPVSAATPAAPAAANIPTAVPTAPDAARPADTSAATSGAKTGEETTIITSAGGSPADEIPAWAKEPAVDAAPANPATVESAAVKSAAVEAGGPVDSAPVNSATATPVAPAPVAAEPIERRRATVAVKPENPPAKNVVQARAKNNPPRPGARAQSFPSSSVIDAVRAQSPPSGSRQGDSSVSVAAQQNGKKAPLRTASYDRNAGRDSRNDVSPSIFIHVRDQSQLAQTMRLKRRLEANGIVVSGIKTVTRGPDDTDLRYFRRSERGEARQMVDLLQSFNVQVGGPKYISGFETTATTRQYELWFPAVN